MPEIKKLKTTTVFNIRRPYVEILTYYNKGDHGDFLFFFFAQSGQVSEGVKILEGDLVMRSGGRECDEFYVDENGYLIVDSDNPERYKINRLDGQLTQEIDD